MGRYIVTDLTRFRNQDIVCTAVIDTETGQCLRPIPYFQSAQVQQFNMHPGAILTGDLVLSDGCENPHIEDADWDNLQYTGSAPSAEFRLILTQSLSPSVSDGFSVQLADGQKHIPVGQNTNGSIITIRVQPRAIWINEDQFNAGKIKASFRDASGHYFRYLSITDRGFHDFAMRHYHDGQLENLQEFIAGQQEVFLRVGLSRRYQSGERDGYWLQVNGIYTFPDLYEEIRQY